MDSQVEKKAANPLLCFLKLQKNRGDAEVKIRARTPLDYPPDKVNMAKKHCFAFDDKTGVQYLPKKETFTFIMTDISGAHIYGYCLLDNSNPESSFVYCILSSLSWRSSFYDILRFIEDQNSNPKVQAKTLQTLKSSSIPTAEQPLVVIPNRIILQPPANMFPGLFGNVSTMVLRSSLTPKLLIEIWVALLFERRVIFKSTSLSTLTDTTSALEELLYPFKWTGIYIMPLPEDLMDYASAPTPYIIGVHSSLYKSLLDKVGSSIVEDGVCVFDIDQQAFYSIEKERDIELIPKKFLKELEKTLKSWEQFAANEIQSAFLTLQARLLLNYRQGFSIEGERVVYSKDLYVASHSDKSHKSFAEAIIGVQMFEQFSQKRLDEVNDRNTTKRNALDQEIASLEELGLKNDIKQLGHSSQSLVNKLFDKTMSKTKQIVADTPRRVNSIKGPMTNRTPRVVQAEELIFDYSATEAAASAEVKPQKPVRPPPPTPSAQVYTSQIPPKPERSNIASLIDFDPFHISQNEHNSPLAPVPAPRTQMMTNQTSSSSNRHDLSEFDPFA